MKSLIYIFVKSFISIILLLYNKTFFKRCGILLDKIYTIGVSHYLKVKNNHIYIERTSSFLGLKYISIGNNSYIHKYCTIEAVDLYRDQKFIPEIIIGEDVEIGEYNHITAVKSIIIGNGVLTGRRVTISDNNHGFFDKESLEILPARRNITCKGEVIIGDNVWIGENVCILSGVTVGRGCIIAANAVVTKDIPEYSLVAGVPAKIIKQLY